MTQDSKQNFSFDELYVLGGHRLALDYVQKLLQGRGAGLIDYKKIFFIEPRADSPLQRAGFDGVKWISSDYVSTLMGLCNRELPAGISIIPDHTAPHVLFQLFIELIENCRAGYGTRVLPFHYDLALPYQRQLDSGIAALSFATWTCPLECEEPTVCPAIRDERAWDFNRDLPMKLAGLPALEHTSRHLFYCEQAVHGVCHLPLSRIIQEWNALRTALATETDPTHCFLVATFSKCHGILGWAQAHRRSS